MMLTVERLQEVLRYDAETGIFTWLKSHQKVCIGDVAGSVDDHGYIRIRVDGRKYRAHRLAWFYVNGGWPAQIDHEDLDKTNNRIKNLRKANGVQNNANKKCQKNNTSGFKGVYYFKPRQRWRAVIYISKKQKYLGTFHTKEQAAGAYKIAALQTFGKFARLT